MYKFLLAFMAAMYVAMLWPLARSSVARRRWISLWRLWSIREVPFALLTLGGVVLLGVTLYSLHPVLSFSWISLVGGEGSLSTGGVVSNAGSNDTVIFLFSLFIFSSFLILIPHLAHIEERWFRRRTETRSLSRRLLVALGFGVTHMAVGVPLSFALALTLLGLSCTRRYSQAFARRRSRADAVRAATSFHLTYNSILAAIFLALVALVLSKPYVTAG